MRFLCVLFIFLSVTVSAQVDTVQLTDSLQIRVIVKSDTVMMSVRQFGTVVRLFHSYERSLAGSREESSMLAYDLRLCDSMLLKSYAVESVLKDQLTVHKMEYDLIQSAAKDNLKLLGNCLVMDKKNRRRSLWRGLVVGVSSGLIGGIITGILIK